MKLAAALAPLALATGLAAPPSPAPTVSPSPAPPSASPAVATPIAQPPPAAPPTQQPTQAPAYRFIYTPPPGATAAPAGWPQIIEVDCTDQVIHQNEDVSMRVVTSPAVSTVMLSALGRQAPLPQIAPGVWGAQSHVPSVPFFFLNRTYTVQIVASTADGRNDSYSFPVRLER
jgi:hypothetical protein